jgi:hypothetical protein
MVDDETIAGCQYRRYEFEWFANRTRPATTLNEAIDKLNIAVDIGSTSDVSSAAKTIVQK